MNINADKTCNYMKTVYQSPEVRIVEMQVQSILAFSTNEQMVSGDKGGWVKENRKSYEDYNVWNDDWSE